MTITFTLPEIPTTRTNAIQTENFPESFTATGTVEFSTVDKTKVYGTGTDFLTSVNIGDWVYNVTDDDYEVDSGMSNIPAQVKSIESNTELTLAENYQGQSGAGKELSGFRCENTIDVAGDLLDISGT
jgi:hypothetical protein